MLCLINCYPLLKAIIPSFFSGEICNNLFHYGYFVCIHSKIFVRCNFQGDLSDIFLFIYFFNNHNKIIALFFYICKEKLYDFFQIIQVNLTNKESLLSCVDIVHNTSFIPISTLFGFA